MTDEQMKKLEESVQQQVQTQRMVANQNLARVASQCDAKQLQNAMLEIEIYCTHMLALIFFNKIAANNIDTKGAYDRLKSNFTNELTWLSEQNLNHMPSRS